MISKLVPSFMVLCYLIIFLLDSQTVIPCSLFSTIDFLVHGLYLTIVLTLLCYPYRTTELFSKKTNPLLCIEDKLGTYNFLFCLLFLPQNVNCYVIKTYCHIEIPICFSLFLITIEKSANIF